MSRRLSAAPARAGALALLVAVLLAGCTQSGTVGQSTGTPAPSTSQAPATPTPAPTPTFVVKTYTCQNILPPATLAVFQSKQSAGFTLQKDYVQRVHNFSPDLSQFDNWGGILCQWAYPETQNSVDYGFSAITAQQATTEQAGLTRNGYVGTAKDHGMVFANTDTTDFPDTYLFIDGYWFYASTTSLLDLIVENVFATPDQ